MPPENSNQPNPQPVPPTNPAPQSQPSPSSPVSPQTTPVYGAAMSPSTPQPQPTPANDPKKKRLLIALVIAFVVLLGGSAAAYFGYYLPNTPENAWNKALDNTAAGYDRLVTYADENKDQKAGTVKGSYKVDAAELVVDGNIDVKYDEKNSATKIDAGFSGTRFDLELLTNIPDNSKNPDIYAKVSGLKGLDQLLGEQGAGVGEALASFDNQWYVIDHTLLDQIEKSSAQANEGDDLPTLDQNDIKAVAEAVGKVNREYLFTKDESKAVLVRKENLGKEELDGRSVQHYKAGYNKDHLKAYVTALANELKNTDLKPYITDDSVNQLQKDIDSLKGDEQAEVWVDLGTKMFRKIRFADSQNKANYVDVMLNYNGGDELPFAIDFVSSDKGSEGTVTVGLTLNTKTDVIKFAAKADGKENDQPIKFNLDATLTPGSEKVEFTKPENAKSLLEALGALSGGALSPDAFMQEPATN